MNDEARSGKWSRVLAVVIFSVGAFVIAQSMTRSPLTGKPAPEITLRVAAGAGSESSQPVSLAQLEQPVVLDFWASWCGACKKSTPLLNKLHADYAKEGVRFYGVNVEAIDASKLRDAHRSFGMDFPTLHDPDGRVQRKYAVSMLPTVVVVGRDGMVAYASVGVPAESALRGAIREATRGNKAQ